MLNHPFHPSLSIHLKERRRVGRLKKKAEDDCRRTRDGEDEFRLLEDKVENECMDGEGEKAWIGCMLGTSCLDTDTGFAPMSSFGVVSDGITSPQSDPLGNRSILLLGSRELNLRTESLVARHPDSLMSFSRVVLFFVGRS